MLPNRIIYRVYQRETAYIPLGYLEWFTKTTQFVTKIASSIKKMSCHHHYLLSMALFRESVVKDGGT